MTSENEIFNIVGPVHLTHINWESPDHQRSIASSLVQGVCVLERDRQQKRVGVNALANPWWEFFGFKLLNLLIDTADSTIFGAIYQLEASLWHQSPSTPRLVIAFRGTLTKKESLARDLQLDLHLLKNDLHKTSRYQIAVEAVHSAVVHVGNGLWLCGHSLGAAIALLAGKNMAEHGIILKTYLFNPPYMAAPIEKIKDEKLKKGVRITKSFITAGLAMAVKGSSKISASNELFAALAKWMPFLYVNKSDHICAEYIGYFEHRKEMEHIGVGVVGRVATRHTLGGLFLSAVGLDSDPIHLIPSASMTINMSPALSFTHAHGIHQWWRQDLHLDQKQYSYC